jgi:DNA mismatch repair protein MutS2
MERAEAEYQRKELERERHELEEERERIINSARAQARRESEAAQAELARIRTQMRRTLTEERLEQLRARAQKIETRNAPLPSRVRPTEKDSAERGESVEATELAVGDTVRVLSMGQQGEVVSLPNARGDVEVQIGALRLRVAASNLERLSHRQARAEATRPQLVTLPSRDESPAPELQLDLRGWRVEDALEEVENYLNDAAMSGLASVRLLHGKGTGALRQAIREQLRHHPLVKQLASAEPRDGGDGVTVVTLAG